VTKTGNGFVRRILVEVAWAYRHTRCRHDAMAGQPPEIAAIARTATHRCCETSRRATGTDGEPSLNLCDKVRCRTPIRAVRPRPAPDGSTVMRPCALRRRREDPDLTGHFIPGSAASRRPSCEFARAHGGHH
jgi:hypothetical protein